MNVETLKHLPKRVLSRLKRRDYAKSFSQCGEDMIVKYYLPKQKGFYVDVGAYHPIHLSNTNHFYNLGWRGINIDATKEAIDVFNKKRPKDVNLNICIGLEDGRDISFFRFEARELNTFREDQLENIFTHHGQKPIAVDKMKLRSLASVLDEYLPQAEEIDLLTIDAEGADEEILRSNNWQKYKPKVIVIENAVTIEDFIKSDIYKTISNFGYIVGGFSRFSFVFYKEGLI